MGQSRWPSSAPSWGRASELDAREKETYAVVDAHKSLEDWVHEKMDTPPGPAGRRARWHEILSKFDLTE